MKKNLEASLSLMGLTGTHPLALLPEDHKALTQPGTLAPALADMVPDAPRDLTATIPTVTRQGIDFVRDTLQRAATPSPEAKRELARLGVTLGGLPDLKDVEL